MEATNTAVVPVEDRWLDAIVAGINREDRRDQLISLLGDAKLVERFTTVALHAIVHDQSKLRQCDPLSIIEAIRESAALGLEPTGLLGEAWILPYGRVAQLRPGYQGYLKLIRNSGQVMALDCQIVYEKDEFHVDYGTAPSITHQPELFGDRGGYRGAYAWARLFSDPAVPIIRWMRVIDIEQARAMSQAGKASDSPWVKWWDQMALKTVIRRLAKSLPRSPQLLRAIELDAEGDEGDRPVAARQSLGIATAREQAVASLEQHYGIPPTPLDSEPAPESDLPGQAMSEAEVEELMSPPEG